jgi:hypothetical protein
MEPDESPENAALELLDSSFDYRERAIRNLMDDAREASTKLATIMAEVSKLNREQIEINKARVELRRLLK